MCTEYFHQKKGSGQKAFAQLRKYVKYPVYAKIPKECMYGANGSGDWASGASPMPCATTVEP